MAKLEKEKSIKKELKKVEESGESKPRELTDEEKMHKDLEAQRRKSDEEGKKFNLFNSDIDKKINKDGNKEVDKVGGADPSLAPAFTPALEPAPSPALAPSLDPVLAPALAPVLDPVLAPAIEPALDPAPSPVPLAPAFEPALKPAFEPAFEPAPDQFPASDTPDYVTDESLDTLSTLDTSDQSLLKEKELLPEKGVTDQIIEEQKLEEEISGIPTKEELDDKDKDLDKDLGIPEEKIPEVEDKVVTHEIYTGCKSLQKRLDTEKIVRSTDLDKLDGCEKLGVNVFLKPLPSGQ